MSTPDNDVRGTYDAVARRYAEEFADDLAERELDRALLASLAELAARASAPATPRVGDLGCGPGFEAQHLAGLGLRVTGVDLSPGMIAEARRRHPSLDLRVGSLLALPLGAASLDGALAMYSLIHLAPGERPLAYREMARVVRPGGALLASFHVSGAGFEPGARRHMDEWWGERVSIDGYFLDPDEVAQGLGAAGFEVTSRVERGPATPREFPSRRCYLLATRGR